MNCQMNFRDAYQEAERNHHDQQRFPGIFSERMIYFFAILLVFALGLILGTIFAVILLPALAAIIVFAAVMAAAIIALLIYRYCVYRRFRRS